MGFDNRPKDFFAKQIRSSHLIASGGIIDPASSDWDEELENLRLLIYPRDTLERASTPGSVDYIEGAFEGIVPPELLNDEDGSGVKVGNDVWLFVSGAQYTQHYDADGSEVIEDDEKEKRADHGVVLFGGDVVISGTLFAERQVVEVDLSQEGELFISGNLRAQEYYKDINFVQFMGPAKLYPGFYRDDLLILDDAIDDVSDDAGVSWDLSGITRNPADPLDQEWFQMAATTFNCSWDLASGLVGLDASYGPGGVGWSSLNPSWNIFRLEDLNAALVKAAAAAAGVAAEFDSIEQAIAMGTCRSSAETATSADTTLPGFSHTIFNVDSVHNYVSINDHVPSASLDVRRQASGDANPTDQVILLSHREDLSSDGPLWSMKEGNTSTDGRHDDTALYVWGVPGSKAAFDPSGGVPDYTVSTFGGDVVVSGALYNESGFLDISSRHNRIGVPASDPYTDPDEDYPGDGTVIGTLQFSGIETGPAPQTSGPGARIEAEAAADWDATNGTPARLNFFTNHGSATWDADGPMGASAESTSDGLAMTIDHEQNVGIGTEIPEAQLHVFSDTDSQYVAKFEKNQDNFGARILITGADDAGIVIEADTNDQGEDDNAFIHFKQDAGRVQAIVGPAGESGNDPLNNSYTDALANAFLVGTLIGEASDASGALEDAIDTHLQLGTKGAVHVTVRHEGKVGIGTTDPQGKLEIQSNGTTEADHQILLHEKESGTGAWSRLSFTNESDTSGPFGQSHEWTVAARSSAQGSSDSAKFNIWYGDAQGGGTGADLLTVKGDGLIGLSETSPDSRLHIFAQQPAASQDIDTTGDGSTDTTVTDSNFWLALNDEEPLAWAHADATTAIDPLKIIGLKADIYDYDANDVEPKVLTVTDEGYVRFKEGGLGGAKLKEDRDGREDPGDTNKYGSDVPANHADGMDGDDIGSPAGTVTSAPYDNGYFSHWIGDTLVGHALDDVNKAILELDESTPWLWPDVDGIPGGDNVILRDAENRLGIGTDDPLQKVHVYAGDTSNTAIRIESNETDADGTVVNVEPHVGIELSLNGAIHGTLSQNTKPSFTTSDPTDLVLQNHSDGGGIYFSTNYDYNSDGIPEIHAPIAIDSNGINDPSELQVLILSGTQGYDPTLNPRLFADTNFFVSGSIGSCVDPTGDGTITGNNERGTAVFGGDVYISGTLYSAGGAIGGGTGGGGGWRTAMNGVCIDVFTESAYGDDGTTPASDSNVINTQLSNDAPSPNYQGDDFSQSNFMFYTTANGPLANGTQVILVLTPNTSSNIPCAVDWTASGNNGTLTVSVPYSQYDPGGNVRVTVKEVADVINTGVDSYGNTHQIRLNVQQNWVSSNITLNDIVTNGDDHNTIGGTTIQFELNGGGDSVRYVSWGADATTGGSPSEGQAENSGDTFTRQDWSQGLLIPFDCTIVGYSVRYMSKDPFKMNAPGVTPSGNEQVVWEIGTLNRGTDPDAGSSYADVDGDGDVDSNDASTSRIFSECLGSDGAPPQWIKWTAADDGTYPLKWIGEGSDGDSTHAASLDISVTAGDTITVRALERDCDVYADYRADASVTLWLQGGNVGGGSGGGSGSAAAARTVATVMQTNGTADDGATSGYTTTGGQTITEYLYTPSLTANENCLCVHVNAGENVHIRLPDPTGHSGKTLMVKDKLGNAAAPDTYIQVSPTGASTLDQYEYWGGNSQPLRLDQSFACVLLWNDGVDWFVS